MSAGEQAVVTLLGADKKQASILRKYCEGLLRAPLLAREVAKRPRSASLAGSAALSPVTT